MLNSVNSSGNLVVNTTDLRALEELNISGLDFQTLGSEVVPQKYICTDFSQRY